MILVDSDVLIAHLRGTPAARDWLRSAREHQPLAVSVVTVAELIGEMRSVERREVRALLGAFRIEPVTDLVARQAGAFMRSFLRHRNR